MIIFSLPSGPNDPRFGPRFFPTNDLYNKKFRDIGKQVARSLNLDGIVREGVYTMVGGPNYETVAELKMLRELGNDQDPHHHPTTDSL